MSKLLSEFCLNAYLKFLSETNIWAFVPLGLVSYTITIIFIGIYSFLEAYSMKKLFEKIGRARQVCMAVFVSVIVSLACVSAVNAGETQESGRLTRFTEYVMPVIRPALHVCSARIADVARACASDAVRYPLSYVGAGAYLSILSKSLCSKSSVKYFGLTMLGVAALRWHVQALKAWHACTTDLDDLLAEHATGSGLAKRNKWDIFEKNELGAQRLSYSCADGYQIWNSFKQQDQRAQKALCGSLRAQFGQESFKQAFDVLEHKLKMYAQSSNIFYKLSCAAHMRSEGELLTSDYLINTDFVKDLKPEFENHIQAGFIAKLVSIRVDRATSWRIPLPLLYDWSYNVASVCVWETLVQYGRLKAIYKICYEAPSQPSSAHHTVTLHRS